MTSWGTTKVRIWLIVVLAVVTVAVGAGAVVAGVVESGKKTQVEASNTAKELLPRVQPTRPVATPQRSTEAPRSPSPTPASSSLPAATMPEVMQTLQAPAPSGPSAEQPAQRPAPAERQPACPSGSVTAALDSIQFEWPYSALPNEVTVVGRGTLQNGASAAIRILEHDVPNLDGLDRKGQIATIALYGEYDWAPPPGVPSGGYVIVQPGESVTYTVKDPTLASSIVPVTHWYSATDLGSVQMYYQTASSLCNVVGMPEGSGKAIPNIFTPKG